jgi:Zn-dependent peptidase ImmA (M78 family)
MTSSSRDEVSARRFALQNPYAHVEQLEELASGKPASHPLDGNSLSNRISGSRKLLENQYAYLDGSGGFSATEPSDSVPRTVERSDELGRRPLPAATQATRASRMSDRVIAARVREIHQRMWRERSRLWENLQTLSPTEMLDPAIALGLIGYECIEVGSLGQQVGSDGVFEVAGIIDSSARSVSYAAHLSVDTRSFTLAHELGHAVLHPNVTGIHRDRPLQRAGTSRDARERDADRFATLFLMPERLVMSEFAATFGAAIVSLDEGTCFALGGLSPDEARVKFADTRSLSRHFASTASYNGYQLIPLAKRFNVSTEAMAIRLEELNLVRLQMRW